MKPRTAAAATQEGDNRSCDLLRKITGNEAEAKDEEYFHITWIGS